MALLDKTRYGKTINFSEDTSTPEGSVALYARASSADGDANELLVLQAPTASFSDNTHISGTLRAEGTYTHLLNQHVTLGDSSLGYSRVTLPSNSQINGSLVTYVNGQGGVGTSSARWGSMYSINLDASGDVTLGSDSTDDIVINGTVGSFTAGTVTGTQFVATSDARLKTDIQVVDNALEAINSLQGVEYDLTTSGEHSMGVLAQDLLEIAPSLVLTGDDGHYAVNYSGLSAFFVEAIKEQQVQIKDQKEQIEELKNLVKELASK